MTETCNLDTDNLDTFVKITDLLKTKQENDDSKEPTLQIQPQDNKQQVKIILVGYKGSIKNYINSFDLFSKSENKLTANIYELLHNEIVINSVIINKTLTKIPIIQIELSNHYTIFLMFEIKNTTVQNFESIPLNQNLNGDFTLEFYNITENNVKKLHSKSYDYTNKKQLIEDLISYIFTPEVMSIIRNCKA